MPSNLIQSDNIDGHTVLAMHQKWRGELKQLATRFTTYYTLSEVRRGSADRSNNRQEGLDLRPSVLDRVQFEPVTSFLALKESGDCWQPLAGEVDCGFRIGRGFN